VAFRAAIGNIVLVMALAGCIRHPQPAGPPKFFVGGSFQSAGEWEYPQDFTSYDETGLALVLDEPKGAITADNEAYDPDGLQAASAVLQLPSIVTLTNLVTGRSVEVRVNDRLIGSPGRLIGVTPHVAELLGFPPEGVVEVEVRLDPQRTAALDAALGEGPQVAAAPEAAVQAQELGAPGSAALGRVNQLSVAAGDSSGTEVGALSGTVTQLSPSPGPLWVQIPGFGHENDARLILESLFGLPAAVMPVFGGDRTLWAIRIGPYHSVAAADAAFDTVLQRGVANPEIIVR
jgi:rare lipoprotein A